MNQPIDVGVVGRVQAHVPPLDHVDPVDDAWRLRSGEVQHLLDDERRRHAELAGDQLQRLVERVGAGSRDHVAVDTTRPDPERRSSRARRRRPGGGQASGSDRGNGG